MRIRGAVVAAAGLTLLGGCGTITFTDADLGQTRDVARGSTFVISLPAVPSASRPNPKMEGALIRFVQRRTDEEGREVFEFQAVGAGDGDIRIPPPPSSAGNSAPEYVLRVRVFSSENVKTRVN